MSTLPIDHAQRKIAIDPTRSFCLAAPAGSGKTSLLTQRILALLCICNNPEEVLAITFTRKAAAEMFHRVIDALLLGSKPLTVGCTEIEKDTWTSAQKVIQRDSQLGWGLLENSSRLKISTIDGLCKNIASKLPLQSNLGGTPNTLEAPWSAYQKAARKLFKHLESEDENIAPDFQIFFEHLDNDFEKAEKLICQLLQCREQWLHYMLMAKKEQFRNYLDENFKSIVKEVLESLTRKLLPVKNDLVQLVNYAATNLNEAGVISRLASCKDLVDLPEASVESVDEWLGISDLFLTGESDWRKTVDKRIGMIVGETKDEKELAKNKKILWAEVLEFMTASQEDILSSFRGVRILPNSVVSDNQWSFIGALSSILPLAAAELDCVFKELGGTDFTAVSIGAINALGYEEDYSDELLKMDNKIRHILVDEVQDTAAIQLRLIERLIAGWQLGDGRTLFMVGDAMQSIYGFRNANVSIFLNIRNGYFKNINVEPLDIEVNFRSQAGIVDWVNSTFQESFPKTIDITRGAAPYNKSIAFKPASGNLPVECHLLIDDHSRKAEAKLTVEIIKAERLSNPSGKIAILARNRNHLVALFEEMKYANLQWTANEIERLADRQVIMDVMSLTRALLNLNDRIAWLSILRAPWLGFNLKTLHTIANFPVVGNQPLGDGFRIIFEQLKSFRLIEGLEENVIEALGKVMPLIESSWNNRRRKSLRQTVEGLWYALGGSAAVKDDSDLINVETFFDLLSKYEVAGQLENMNEFEQALSRLYASPSSNADRNLVVMSMHAAKGLEFSTVILLGLDRGNKSDEKELLVWQESVDALGDERLLMAAISETGAEDSGNYKYLREEKRIKNKLENNRLLYVGCTRAINKLHLIGQTSRNTSSGLREPSEASLLSSIWPTFNVEAKVIEPNVQDMQYDTQKTLDGGKLEKITLVNPVKFVEEDFLLARFRGTNLVNLEENMPSTTAFWLRDDRAIGRAIHRYLYAISITGFSTWYDQFWPNDTAIKRVLMGEGYTGNESGIAKVKQALINVQNSEKGRWILDSANHLEADSEAAFLMSRNGEVEQRIIDRTFIDTRGIRWIIDYKSSYPAKNQDIGEFLAGEVAEYSNQLFKYREIFQHENRMVKLGLYFPMLGALEEVA